MNPFNTDNLRPLLDLDRIVHEPARLVILTVLASSDAAEFKFLESLTGLTKGNLSSHTAKLEAAGYLTVHKEFRGRLPSTSFKITPAGRTALDTYRNTLSHMAAAAPRPPKRPGK